MMMVKKKHQQLCVEKLYYLMVKQKFGVTDFKLVHFFTAGHDEVRQWTVREGSKAPQAGAVIHTDFEKFFICAEQMKLSDLLELGSEAACKAEGLNRQQGKEYVVLDGDVLYFKIGATQGKKK